MSVPLLDLSRQYAYLKPEMDKAVVDVLTHGKFILGPEVKELEAKIAELCATKYAWGVASGTDALLLALKAAGIKAGDEVITTDFSFFATAGTIIRHGAKPVFVDIEADSYNIDPTKIEAAITDKTTAIIPVHLYGQIADMDAIMEIAKKHNLKVVEDGAQAIGSGYKDKNAGSMGHFGCFSFFPSKNLGAGGDGGIVTCNDDDDGEMVRILRNHGAKPKYYHKLVGYNSRLATLQAAILLVKLPHLEGWSKKRIEHAKIYDDAFASIEAIKTPVVKDYTTFHIYNQYTIAVSNRDELLSGLKEQGIGCEVYYPVSFHSQECFSDLGQTDSDLPVSTKAAKEVLSLPIYPEMTSEEQQTVIEAVKKLIG